VLHVLEPAPSTPWDTSITGATNPQIRVGEEPGPLPRGDRRLGDAQSCGDTAQCDHSIGHAASAARERPERTGGRADDEPGEAALFRQLRDGHSLASARDPLRHLFLARQDWLRKRPVVSGGLADRLVGNPCRAGDLGHAHPGPAQRDPFVVALLDRIGKRPERVSCRPHPERGDTGARRDLGDRFTLVSALQPLQFSGHGTMIVAKSLHPGRRRGSIEETVGAVPRVVGQSLEDHSSPGVLVLVECAVR
jgi:hypothetical protein